jgi:predicted signal transduction protein with EAL and GGDEF domain
MRRGGAGLPWLVSGAALVAGLGIIAMIVAAPPPGSDLYYAGLLLVCMGMYMLFELPLTYALVLSWTLVLLYEALAAGSGLSPVILLNNTFFLVSTNVVGMVAAYSRERGQRASFIDQRIIHALASRDSLTGLLNRRAFLAEAEGYLRDRRRATDATAVVMVDVDRDGRRRPIQVAE